MLAAFEPEARGQYGRFVVHSLGYLLSSIYCPHPAGGLICVASGVHKGPRRDLHRWVKLANSLSTMANEWLCPRHLNGLELRLLPEYLTLV